MVALIHVQSFNSLIASSLPPDPVAIFVGATGGLGKATIKQSVKHSRQSRAYIVGRSQDAADRILAECKALNSEGDYVFVKANVRLIHAVDEVCEEIKAKETAINALFPARGLPLWIVKVDDIPRRYRSNSAYILAALSFCFRFRFRFITKLLPLLPRGTVLHRVVAVAGDGLEGPLDPSDVQARRIQLTAIRGHLSTLVILVLESIANMDPEVSFVHNFPGAVSYWICVPIEECGDRQFSLATSARYPPASVSGDGGSGVPLSDGHSTAVTRPSKILIDTLLDAGVDLELPGDDYGTLLMSAWATGRLEVVKSLVRKGARTS